jgi:hypothetical protein
VPAEDPCPERIIKVRSFHLRWAVGVELVLAPRGYERVISSGRHMLVVLSLSQPRSWIVIHLSHAHYSLGVAANRVALKQERCSATQPGNVAFMRRK